MNRVAVFWDQFGPYHWSRLEAAGRRMPLDAVEVFGRCATRAWGRVEKVGSFNRSTLFPEADVRRIRIQQVRDRVREELDRLNPPVVAIHGWAAMSALTALAWCQEHDRPAVLMSETVAVYKKARYWWKELIKRRLVRLFSTALVGGKSQCEYLATLGMPAERMFPGYDAVDNDYFVRAAQDARSMAAELRLRHNLPEAYWLFCGRFIEEKNLPRLLEAFARYRALVRSTEQEAKSKEQREGSKAWDLVLLGDGPLREKLRAKSQELGVGEWVHWPGFKQYGELPACYAFARAFVLPSVSEMWGLVVNEAMACGLPVLVSRHCGCAAELVEDGRNGFTFDPLNVEQLTGSMLRMSCLEEGARSRMGEASREIIARWSPDLFGDNLKRAVELARRVPRPRATATDRGLLKLLLACGGSRG